MLEFACKRVLALFALIWVLAARFAASCSLLLEFRSTSSVAHNPIRFVSALSCTHVRVNYIKINKTISSLALTNSFILLFFLYLIIGIIHVLSTVYETNLTPVTIKFILENFSNNTFFFLLSLNPSSLLKKKKKAYTWVISSFYLK